MTVRVCQPSAHFLECKEVVAGREDSHFCTEPARQQYCIDINMSLLSKVLGNQKAEERDAGEHGA